MLTVYKASAGSGKTFRLVTEYLKLLLAGDQNHRHILAVTFTNKATAEMKERIVDQLYNLAAGKESPYREVLLEETGLAEGELAARASVSLSNLLFDFSRFQVSTIDKFTQRILKAFCREAGINPAYELETDNDLLIAEAADRLIAGMGENPRLQRWLRSFVEDKIRNNRSFSITYDLTSLGNELFREQLQDKLRVLEEFFAPEENSHRYLEILNDIVYRFAGTLKQQSAGLVGAYTRAGFTAGDFSYGDRGVAGFLEKTAAGEVPPSLGIRVMKAAADAEGWVAKSSKKQEALREFTAANLVPGLQQLVRYYSENSRNYFTAKVILSEWYTAAVLTDLYKELANLGRDRGILPLSGSNLLLKGIIDGNDTPFIYEKTGNIIGHLMLDEFQDTSGMQWSNFRPLVANSLSQGKKSLVVGDVKQSIYRWRNGNWNLLESGIFSDFRNFPVQEKSLKENYRSGREIVDFNSRFFGVFLQVMADYGQAHFTGVDFQAPLRELYRDVVQKPATKQGKPAGFAGICRVDATGEEFTERTLEKLVEQVRQLQDRGFRAGTIAILVRRKEQGVWVVRHFLREASLPGNRDYNLKIVSGDSLMLGSSPGVGFIIHWLKYLIDSDDRLNRAALLHLYNNYVRPVPGLQCPGAGGLSPGMAGWNLTSASLGEFDTLLVPLFSGIENQLAISSLDEKITRICATFGLFDLTAELPFLQVLIDKASEMNGRLNGDVPGFLTWWEEEGQKVGVTAGGETDAIRLLTIHASKGLEFEAVLMPFCDWKLSENKNNILWCTPVVSPFNMAPLVPVAYSGTLGTTWFDQEYRQEFFNILVDNLNLLYVAFTRARSVLWVSLPARGASGTMAALVNEALPGSFPQMPGACHATDGWEAFTTGEIPAFPDPQAAPRDLPETRWHFTDYSGRLRLKTLSGDFLEGLEKGITRKNFGKQVHALLSQIKTREDVEPACKRALAAGMVQPREFDLIREHVGKMIAHPVAVEWFSGKLKILTETDLLTSSLTLRPDRIMISGDQAVIVDFKTGMRNPEHENQVRQYTGVLRQTGFREVKGYLWYIRDNRLLEVR